jgi:bifunctional non-homologous end joining protein LigD
LNVPLQGRRALLDDIFAQAGGEKSPLKLSEIVDAPVSELIRVAKAMGFEGIPAKRRDSFYESGKRSGAWQNTASTRAKSS